MEQAFETKRIPPVEEDEASAEVREIYDDVKQFLQVPFVPNGFKVAATSPAALKIHWAFTRAFYENSTLPHALSAMIMYTIATKNNCVYCSTNNELTCRTLGIDEDTLAALVEDLASVSPQRIRAIIEFSLKVAKYPQTVIEEDYEILRRHGVSDGEIVEIVQVAGAAVFMDIMSDALKIEVEEPTSSALASMRGS